MGSVSAGNHFTKACKPSCTADAVAQTSYDRAPTPRLWCALVLLCEIAVGGACSVLVDSDRQQCVVDTDCAGSEQGYADAICVDSVCEENPTWACLDKVTWPTPEPRPATVVIRLRELVQEVPALGVSGRLCRKLDFECAQPIISGMRADATGTLTVQVETGFDGYVELTAPDRIPGIYFFYPPVRGDREIPNVPMIKAAELQQFAALAGRPVLAGRGHVMLGAYDCLERPADGVVISTGDGDADTTPFYLIKKIPSLTAMSTDSSGRGGIINLPAGSRAVQGGTPAGRRIASVGIFVRPGTITYTTLLPAPR